MSRFGAPGVYYQSVDAGAPPVTPLRTDITGFVGIAERGPVDCPVAIGSWRQFVTWFGSFSGAGYLAYAVRAFFENGGRRCWVVRVASKTGGAACAATVVHAYPAPMPALSPAVWLIRASSEGTWGNSLAVTMREHNPAQTSVVATAVDGTWSDVADVSGLRRAAHVRISQEGRPAAWKVVAAVDANRRRVHWVHPDRDRRLPYDAPLTRFDGNRAILVESVEYSILVTESGRVVRFYDGLTLVPEHGGYAPARLLLRPWVEDPESGATQPVPPEPILVEDVRGDLNDLTGMFVDPFVVLALVGGQDGLAALAVDDFVGAPVAPDDGPVAVALKRRGIRALEELNEVGLVAVPDAQVRPVTVNPMMQPAPCISDPCTTAPVAPHAAPPRRQPGEQPPTFSPAEVFRIQSELVLQCERLGDRFALLDAPIDTVGNTLGSIRPIQEWRSRFDTRYAAITFPWLRVLDPAGTPSRTTRAVPPSGHVAGVVAATDLRAGVHHAPANKRLEWALDTTDTVDDERHGLLNAIGVNVLRTTAGRGLRVQGARTMSSDPDWRFLNVRRFVSVVEKALEIGLQWAVFEPNSSLLRARATMAVTIFLLGLHEDSMLAGATPDESFFVKCDLDNNPAGAHDAGRLLIEIGIAPTKPFEFVVLRVGRVRDSIEVSETSGVFGATTVGV